VDLGATELWALQMRPSLLLVAAHIDLRARIARALQSSGFALELAGDDKRALALASERSFLAAIVALGSIRTHPQTLQALRDALPQMIVLSERADEVDYLRHSFSGINAFHLNASNEERVIGRIGEMIRIGDRAREAVTRAPSTLRIDGCMLDLVGHTFTDAQGRQVALTRAEAELLQELARHPQQTLSRDELRQAITCRRANRADQSVEPFDRSVDMLVARLRRKIELDLKVPQFLITVPGVGYKLVVEPHVADARRAEVERNEPERRQITALSCNLAGAMQFAVSCDPEDLSRTTKSFQAAAVDAVTAMGGTIVCLMPDQILAAFGYPEAHEDDPERAVNAGCNLVENVAQVLSPTGGPLQVRVGVATGLALVSHNETVGEPSASASALSTLAAPNSVLVTGSTRRLLSNAIVCDEQAQHALVGIPQPVCAYRVTARRGVGSRFKATRSKTPTHLVGRERDLQQLMALWEKANRGEGQIALICGEAGIGKSHLCEFFLGRLVDQPHLPLRYQCSPYHLNSPFYPVISHLEHAFGFEPADTPELKLKKLKRALSQAGDATPDDVYSYAKLFSISMPELESLPVLTPQRQKNRTFNALIRHLQSIAQKQPLIIVLSDAHWIDSSTLELANRILPLIKTARILLVVEFRPEFNPQWPDEPYVTTLRLERMPRDESLTMISEEIGGKRLPQELEDHIIAKTDGVPLFIEELTKSVTESGLVREVAGQYVATGHVSSLNVPASLLDSLTARLDRLGCAKEVAQVGAVIGREFSHALLSSVAAQSAKSLEAALAQLTASELISTTCNSLERTYVFKHALVRDAAYATLPRAKRQHMHSQIADVLENGFPLLIETQPELLAHHLAQAGLSVRAIEYLQRAARRAIERSANVEAIGHLDRALELLDSVHDSVEQKPRRFSLETLLSQAMIARYGYAARETQDTLFRARTLIEDSTEPSHKFPVLYGIWASHYVAGEVAKQSSAAAEFLMEAERSGDAALRCIGHRLTGTTHLTKGEFASASDHLRQAWALYDPEHHAGYRHQYGQDIGASTLCYLSWALWHLGYVDQASRAAAEAMALAEKLFHPHTLVYTICHAHGFMDLFRRRHEYMKAYADVAVAICNENGFLHWANCGTIFSGWTAACENQADLGIRTLQKGLAGWQKTGGRLWMPMFLMLQAQAYAKGGQIRPALETIEQAIGACENDGERWAKAEILRIKAALLARTGAAKWTEVEAILLDSLDIAQRQGARCWRLRAACDLSRLWQRQGRNGKALELLQSVYDEFTEGLYTEELLEARKLLLDLRRSPARIISKDCPKQGVETKRKNLTWKNKS
jgi:class 3 adenylate cyclase/DNA-binding response OmpR family regulator/predicted ATPase